jgi:group I intron endonuclease
MIGIYKITNPNGLTYIGQSIDIEKRWGSYFNLNCKDQSAIYNSLLKHGVKLHKFEVLEECAKEDLIYREIFYIELYNSFKRGLNSARVGLFYNKKKQNSKPKKKTSTKKINNSLLSYDLKWQLKDNPNYKITKCKKVVNTNRNKIVKCVLNGGSIGWWIGGKFIAKSKMNNHLEIIPKLQKLPF